MIKINKQKIIIIFFLLFILAVMTVFLMRPIGKKPVGKAEGWMFYSSNLLGFSAKVPSDWRIAEIAHRESVFFDSNIPVYKNNKEVEEKFYAIAIKRLKLEEGETLENYFFPKEQFGENRNNFFQKEELNGNFIYTTPYLGDSDKILSIFISKDQKEFLRYSVIPYTEESNLNNYAGFSEKLKEIIKATELL